MSKPSYWNKTSPYNPLMANKGRALEDMIKYQNTLYENKGISNIQKISTPWKVIRRGKEIVSAFPEEKSTVDFRGTVRGGIPVSFDAKESDDERGLPLKYIASHQIDYMRGALYLGEISFILCEIKPIRSYYIIPGATVLQFWDYWQSNKGKHGINFIPKEHMVLIKSTQTGNVIDYLPTAIGSKFKTEI